MSTIRLPRESNLQEKDQLYYEPPHTDERDGSQEFLIFMITGNPGFISFYEPFLSTLHSLLSSSPSRFYISGYSLDGFHDPQKDRAVGLGQQIDYVEKKLFKQVEALSRSTDHCPKVILMGHSVGAYILLELIRQHRQKVDEGNKDFDLIGGILLFPTIVHIAQSPQGKIYNVSLTSCWSKSPNQSTHARLCLIDADNPSTSPVSSNC